MDPAGGSMTLLVARVSYAAPVTQLVFGPTMNRSDTAIAS